MCMFVHRVKHCSHRCELLGGGHVAHLVLTVAPLQMSLVVPMHYSLRDFKVYMSWIFCVC